MRMNRQTGRQRLIVQAMGRVIVALALFAPLALAAVVHKPAPAPASAAPAATPAEAKSAAARPEPADHGSIGSPRSDGGQAKPAAPVAPVAHETPAVRLSAATVPAQGRRESVATVHTFGRYTIAVASKEGVALTLLDRMTGPGEENGTPGKADGRLDVFLEAGDYKILTRGADKATGEARLTVHPFREQHAGQALALVEEKPIATQLADGEQRSYWIDIPERRRVEIQAAGRSLADVRLWRDGRWLTEQEPTLTESTPTPGTNWGLATLTAELPPGLYLLTAYGGPARASSDPAAGQPLHLRFGIPQRPAFGHLAGKASAFGRDRFRVPRAAGYFRLELPGPEAARLTIQGYPVRDGDEGQSQTILRGGKTSSVQLTMPTADNGEYLVTVERAPGQPYLLQHFIENPPPSKGPVLAASVVSAGQLVDTPPLTALAVTWPTGDSRKIQIVAAGALPIGPDSPWRGRFQIQGRTTVFLDVRAAATYRIRVQGVPTAHRVEPFFVTPPEFYHPPDLAHGAGTWDLNPGYYTLSLLPDESRSGPVDVRIWSGAEQAGEALAESPSFPPPVFPRLAYHQDDDLGTLHLNVRPGIHHGLALRPLPLNLATGLPFALGPGQKQSLEVEIPKESYLRVATADGPLDLVLTRKDTPVPTDRPIPAGRYTLAVTNVGHSTAQAELSAIPTLQAAESPLPVIPKGQIEALPEFPPIALGSPVPLDLDSGEERTFAFHLAEAGFYRLESEGLLDTTGRLRTRTRTSFATATANGLGRNFLIQQYLGPGDYQLTVKVRAPSRGHLAVRLGRGGLVQGGPLAPGAPVAHALPAGTGLVHQLVVPELGKYRIRVLRPSKGTGASAGGATPRIEDSAGWPLPPSVPEKEKTTAALAPASGEGDNENSGGDPPPSATTTATGDLTRELPPGTYHLFVLPSATEARVATAVDLLPPPRAFKGHGPHEIGLSGHYQAVWEEPGPGEKRTPDLWRIAVPAPLTVSLRLTGEMRGVLRRETVIDRQPGKAEKGQAEKGSSAKEKAETGKPEPGEIAQLTQASPFHGALAPGAYRLEVAHLRADNHSPYTLTADTDELYPGAERTVTVPAELPLAYAHPGLLAVRSLGTADVRARLFAGERLVAESDDADGDWNFHLVADLPAEAGLAAAPYTLKIEPVGAPKATTTLRVLQAPEATLTYSENDASGALFHVQQGGGLFSLPPAEAEEVLVAEGRATATLHLALEGRDCPAAPGTGAGAAPSSPSTGPGQAALQGAAAAVPGACPEDEASWRLLARDSGKAPWLALPRAPTASSGRHYRLRVLAEAGSGSGATVRLRNLHPKVLTETRLAEGIATPPATARPEPVEGSKGEGRVPGAQPFGERENSIAAFDLTGPGLFLPPPGAEAPALRAADGLDAPFLPVPADGIRAHGQRLYLAPDPGAPGAGPEIGGIAARRAALGPEAGRHLVLAPQRDAAGTQTAPAWLDVAPGEAGPLLVRARAVAGAPHLRLHTADLAPLAGDWIGVAHHAAVAVALDGKARALSVARRDRGGLHATTTLDARRFPAPKVQDLPLGNHDLRLPPGQAGRYRLPAGDKRLRLLLPAEATAVFLKGGSALTTHYAGPEASLATLDLAADEVLLLPGVGGATASASATPMIDTGAGAAKSTAERAATDAAADLGPALTVGLAVLPQPQAGAPSLATGHALFLSFAEAGTYYLAVAPGKGNQDGLLHAVGAALAPVAYDGDGQLGEGIPLALSQLTPGILALRHEAGPFLAWIGPAGAPPPVLDGEVLRGWRGGLPAQLSLDAGLSGYRIQAAGPTLLTVQAEAPILVGLRRRPPGSATAAAPASGTGIAPASKGAKEKDPLSGDGIATHMATPGTPVDLLLPPGDHTLLLAPAAPGGAAMATLTGALPQEMGEGLSPAVALAPGDRRLFSFAVPDARDIGIGVRATPDTAIARLFRATGEVIGVGTAQMHKLATGTYLLALGARAGGPAITAQAAVVGLKAPDKGPPEETIRAFLQGEGQGAGQGTGQGTGRE
jgi:hypothetical protein